MNGTDELTRPLTVSEWLLTLVVLAIPMVNIVAFLYWSFGNGVNVNKRNFCRAGLVWMAIIMGLFFVMAVFGGFAAMLNQ